MECAVCGIPLRRNNKTGYCYAHRRMKNRQVLQMSRRKCLKCDREFLAMGKFNRICPRCRETNKEIVNVSRYQSVLKPEWIGLG